MAHGTSSIKSGQEHKKRGHNPHSTASPRGSVAQVGAWSNLEEVTSMDGSGVDASVRSKQPSRSLDVAVSKAAVNEAALMWSRS
jgi:hypothetical protein